MIKLGYSLGAGPNPKHSIKERIKILSSVETHGVELGYVVGSRLEEKLDAEDIQELKKFQYLSIHAPAILNDSNKKEWIRYPSNEAEETLEKIIKIAKVTNADSILFHPDLIDDFAWLNKKIGNLLAIENMDAKKSFGKSVEDLKKIFSQAHDAKWVCDVNHIYTIDRSMKLAEAFHSAFQDRICHYHLSGYGGFHDCLHISQEDIILEGIKDFSVPIIHEGRALRDGDKSLIKENKYILERLSKKH